MYENGKEVGSVKFCWWHKKKGIFFFLLLLQTLNTRYTELIIWHYLFSFLRERETEISMPSGADRKP